MSRISGGRKAGPALKRIAEQMQAGTRVQVGFLANARYPDGTLVAQVAYWNEYGHMTASGRFVGPWPFFRNMIAAKQKEWPKAFAIQLKKTNYDLIASLKIMGEGIRGQLQASIRAIMSPTLSEYTIRAKGFSKPMIDTSHMLNSADYEVISKSGKGV